MALALTVFAGACSSPQTVDLSRTTNLDMVCEVEGDILGLDLDRWSGVDAIIFFQPPSNGAEINAVEDVLERAAIAESVYRLSPEEGLAEWREMFAESEYILASTTADDVPIQLRVRAVENGAELGFRTTLKAVEFMPGVFEVVERVDACLSSLLTNTLVCSLDKDSADMVVVLAATASEVGRSEVEGKLDGLAEVTSVRFVNSEVALNEVAAVMNFELGTSGLGSGDISPMFQIVTDNPSAITSLDLPTITGVSRVVPLPAADCP